MSLLLRYVIYMLARVINGSGIWRCFLANSVKLQSISICISKLCIFPVTKLTVAYERCLFRSSVGQFLFSVLFQRKEISTKRNVRLDLWTKGCMRMLIKQPGNIIRRVRKGDFKCNILKQLISTGVIIVSVTNYFLRIRYALLFYG